jgi:cell pole-organizing protein PopZ
VFEKAVREGFEPVFQQWLGSNTDAVVERFKPLIREWMDAHFPALLEGAVRAEVERVARARH